MVTGVPGGRARSALARRATRFADVRWVAETGSTNADALALARRRRARGHRAGGRPPDRRAGAGRAARGGAAGRRRCCCRCCCGRRRRCWTCATMAVAVAAAEAVERGGRRRARGSSGRTTSCGPATARARPQAGRHPRRGRLAGRRRRRRGLAARRARAGASWSSASASTWPGPTTCPTTWPTSRSRSTTSPARPVDREDLLVALLAAPRPPLRRAGRPATAPACSAAWRARSATLGRRVRVDLGADDVEGTAVDVTDEGHLVVDTLDGDRRTFAVGDVVHLRPALTQGPPAQGRTRRRGVPRRGVVIMWSGPRTFSPPGAQHRWLENSSATARRLNRAWADHARAEPLGSPRHPGEHAARGSGRRQEHDVLRAGPVSGFRWVSPNRSELAEDRGRLAPAEHGVQHDPAEQQLLEQGAPTTTATAIMHPGGGGVVERAELVPPASADRPSSDADEVDDDRAVTTSASTAVPRPGQTSRRSTRQREVVGDASGAVATESRRTSR